MNLQGLGFSCHHHKEAFTFVVSNKNQRLLATDEIYHTKCCKKLAQLSLIVKLVAQYWTIFFSKK
jgi:hypothetical protein